MTKKELIKVVAEELGRTQKEVTEVTEKVLEAVVAEVAKGEKVALAGFGSFETVERAARTGRNPQTGEEIEIAASVSPKFKAAKAFKDAVKGE